VGSGPVTSDVLENPGDRSDSGQAASSQIAHTKEWLTINNSCFALLRPFALVRAEAVSDQIQDPRRGRRYVVDPSVLGCWSGA
jgi:hypothetical protein